MGLTDHFVIGCGGKSDFAPMARKKRQKPLPPLAGRVFTKVSDAEAEIRRILQTYEPVETPVEGDDGELVTAWMRNHESMSYAEDEHGPLLHIEIRFNPNVRAKNPIHRRQVWCVFSDGYADSFSYKADRSNWGVVIDEKTANAKMRSHWAKKVARLLIDSDIEEYKQAVVEGEGVCELSNRPITLETAEVHHEGLSFMHLLHSFMKEWCITSNKTIGDVEVVKTNSYGGKKFADDQMNTDWIQYHAENAKLVCVHEEVHDTLHKNMEKPNWEELY